MVVVAMNGHTVARCNSCRELFEYTPDEVLGVECEWVGRWSALCAKCVKKCNEEFMLPR
jgi:hypothetical protein